MSGQLSQAQNAAYAAVRRIAPNEIPIFDEVWEDLAASSTAIGTLAEVESGGGVDPNVLLWSSVVIPIVVPVITHSLNTSVDTLFELLRKRVGLEQGSSGGNAFSDEELKRIAAIIAEELDRHKRM